ncbi:MAG: hypothetical protein B5766_00315 [Candidatus Lumbricidophila eiseniae]|uniref:Uncharacterized protein n=1 Tax=Candidatus Lumbricidiphila eiseniae TaxID=1969409 RepID=A0A2A6FUI1_9MICO|nr:MAG: hypothetical protein B5766_00315 [Candidatus Lumbricidophila eiseniae]
MWGRSDLSEWGRTTRSMSGGPGVLGCSCSWWVESGGLAKAGSVGCWSGGGRTLVSWNVFRSVRGDAVSKWMIRYRVNGTLSLQDRSSRTHRCPHQTRKRMERWIIVLRVTRVLGCLPNWVSRACVTVNGLQVVFGRYRIPF